MNRIPAALSRTTRGRRGRIAAVSVTAALIGAAAAGTAAGQQPEVNIPISGCPALFVLGVQGTGQSSPSADPTTDNGMLGAMFGPMLSGAPGLIQRAYVGYDAGFGGAVPGGGTDPYTQSEADAVTALDVAAGQVIRACPTTLLAGAGYSQGAHAMSQFAAQVGTGRGPVPADRVAGIALYSDPTRPAESPVFPGDPGQDHPAAAPGTSGAAVAHVRLADSPPVGAGIAADAHGFGALSGRVAEICVAGDLSCDAPDHAALLRAGAGMAAQANLRSPADAIGSLGGIWSNVLAATSDTVVNEDVSVVDGRVDYTPRQDVSTRLADASDPRTAAPSPQQRAAADAKRAAIAAAVAANPIETLPRLAAQLAAAVPANLAANADLLNLGVLAGYADVVSRHTTYRSNGQMAAGAAWFDAIAHDIKDAR